ncbi:hypothetical protein LPTSP4_34820 [Leptospira ryugenii]|uniref:Uncharacterized protein n=1 Tax=Leptospira ryugenii TaxID=1917863 RepID=A0A2P2E502_9LEPT|nr:hypothetical protein LPTSP4_34820 [Leptospira ryugenii]
MDCKVVAALPILPFAELRKTNSSKVASLAETGDTQLSMTSNLLSRMTLSCSWYVLVLSEKIPDCANASEQFAFCFMISFPSDKSLDISPEVKKSKS